MIFTPRVARASKIHEQIWVRWTWRHFKQGVSTDHLLHEGLKTAWILERLRGFLPSLSLAPSPIFLIRSYTYIYSASTESFLLSILREGQCRRVYLLSVQPRRAALARLLTSRS